MTSLLIAVWVLWAVSGWFWYRRLPNDNAVLQSPRNIFFAGPAVWVITLVAYLVSWIIDG